MILKLTLTAGLALGLGGQALALTCADNERAAEYFVDCGEGAAEGLVSGLLASLQTAVPASAMRSDVSDADDSGRPPGSSGFSGGTLSGAPSDRADPTLVAAVNGETEEDMSGGTPLVIPGMPVNEDGRPTPGDVASDPLGVVPLPAGGLLLIGGLGGLGLLRRSRKTAS